MILRDTVTVIYLEYNMDWIYDLIFSIRVDKLFSSFVGPYKALYVISSSNFLNCFSNKRPFFFSFFFYFVLLFECLSW